MSKQTAVEWLVEEMSKYGYAHTFKLYQRQVKQAKEMEKEQLKEMYLKGIENYDPTFKRKEGEQ